MIYIIGDSHVSIFSGVDKTEDGKMHMQPEFGYCYTLKLGQLRQEVNKFEQKLPHFTAIKVGSHTAYNLHNKLPKIEQAICEYNIGEDDYIFTCFGQIDIQNHLLPNSTKNNVSIDETIQICVNKYINTINELKNKFTKVKFGVYAPPATSIGVGKKPRITKEEAIKYNEITLKFNEYLKLKCEENNLIFKDFSKKLLLPNGQTDDKFVVDDIHLSIETIPFILKEFEDIIC